MVKWFMYQYFLAVRKLADTARSASIAVDAVRVGGEELVTFAMLSNLQEQACWLPCQAPE
eukprot:6461386-Prorocentrum_lima.AAC.1